MKWTVIHLSKPCKDIMHEQDLKSIRFDNETNFVGSNESKKIFTEMDQEQISRYLLQNGTDWSIWHKNPLGTSYTGEVWDHQIWHSSNILMLY